MKPLIFALATVLGACNNGTGPNGPTEAERAVIGSWAGEMDAQGVTLFLLMTILADHKYTLVVRVGGNMVERELGTWLVSDSRLHFAPDRCDRADDVGGPLRPVTCSAPHSIPVVLEGGKWFLNFDAGEGILTFEMRRI